MKVLGIDLDESEMPERIRVEMTREEAIMIADHVGSVTPSRPVTSAVWDALTGSVFNRFWDDGVDDARRYNRA